MRKSWRIIIAIYRWWRWSRCKLIWLTFPQLLQCMCIFSGSSPVSPSQPSSRCSTQFSMEKSSHVCHSHLSAGFREFHIVISPEMTLPSAHSSFCIFSAQCRFVRMCKSCSDFRHREQSASRVRDCSAHRPVDSNRWNLSVSFLNYYLLENS